MSRVNFQRTYNLGEAFDEIKNRAFQKLEKYWDYSNLFTFNVIDSSVTFSTERIISANPQKRPRVMLLFSNPHPHSITQGMFLSPNTHGQENLFWPVMQAANWLSLPDHPESPTQRADRFIQGSYPSEFDLVFYCYFAFPTDYPEDISTIFGKEYFRKNIEPEAQEEFRNTLRNIEIEAVVTFNKG